MSKSNALENALLLLILNNTNIADIGDATGLRGSSAEGSVYVALHLADPAEGGAQNANELSYTGYGRVAVARSALGWTVTGNSAVNAAEIAFGECTAGSETATHFSIGVASSGATVILYKGALTAPLAISAGVTPRFEAGDLEVTED